MEKKRVVNNDILGVGLLSPSYFGNTINRHSPTCKVHDSDAFWSALGGCTHLVPGQYFELSHFTGETGHIRNAG
jgi:hypothetical protein